MVLRIFKMIATSGFATALEFTKVVFDRAPPRTSLGELTAVPQTPSLFKGPTSKGSGREGKGEGKGKEGERMDGTVSFSQIRGSAPGYFCMFSPFKSY